MGEGETYGDRGLMRLHAEVLFRYDGRGRMVCTNEPEERPAPWVFLGRSLSGYVVRFGQGVPDDVVERIEGTVAGVGTDAGLEVPEGLKSAVREVLEEELGGGAQEGGWVYRFPEQLGGGHEAVQLTEGNVELARDTFPWLLQELAGWWPCYAVVRDGAAVSVCFSSRIGETACEAGVDTLPAHRRRGYAASAVTAWGAAIRASGRIPLYSTSWDNLASQGVARRVGLVMFGTEATWR